MPVVISSAIWDVVYTIAFTGTLFTLGKAELSCWQFVGAIIGTIVIEL